MENLVRDIRENCNECECDIGATIKYLYEHGDISATSEKYREIWRFYTESLKLFKAPKRKLQARKLTLEHFNISYQTFKKIKLRVNPPDEKM